MHSLVRSAGWSAVTATLAAASIATFALGGAIQWHPLGAGPIAAETSPDHFQVAVAESCETTPGELQRPSVAH